jgi:hypothetical protein
MRGQQVHPSGWDVVKLFDGAMLSQIHVIPVDDLRCHDEHPNCWCSPFQDDEEPLMWGHNSMDGRERFEQGRALS